MTLQPLATSRWRPVLVGVGLGILALTVCMMRPDFELLRYGKAVAYAVSILGLSIVVGHSGQFSLAQGAFTGLGAYTAAILIADHGWHVLATIPAAALVGFAAGCLLGLPALRVKGHYLATMTLGVAIVFPLVINRYSDFTGGANGKLALLDFDAPFGLALTPVQWRFLVICAVAGLCFLFVRNVLNSRVGRAMAMVRSNEVAATSLGIGARTQRVLAFGYAGLFGAVAGPLLVMVLEVVGPGDYSLLFTILLTTGLIVGGAHRLMGAVLGGFVVALLPTFTAEVASGPQANILYAALLIGMIFLLPGGLASLPAVISARLSASRTPADTSSDTSPPGRPASALPTDTPTATSTPTKEPR